MSSQIMSVCLSKFNRNSWYFSILFGKINHFWIYEKKLYITYKIKIMYNLKLKQNTVSYKLIFNKVRDKKN